MNIAINLKDSRISYAKKFINDWYEIFEKKKVFKDFEFSAIFIKLIILNALIKQCLLVKRRKHLFNYRNLIF